MWTRDSWNEIDPDKPAKRMVTITLEEYRELVRESANHDSVVDKKDKEIFELKGKVDKLQQALTRINDITDDDDEVDD